MSGRNHSDETKKIMSEAKKGLTGENNPRFGKPRPEGAGRAPQQIEVTDLQEKTKTNYNSLREAARALNLPSYKSISMYFKQNQQKPYKGRYTFNKI
jgi:hypothetical protein